MKFEVHLNRDKLKPLENILVTLQNILKHQKNDHYLMMMIYIASHKHIRLLYQRENSSMVFVLQQQVLNKVISSSSKNNTEKMVEQDEESMKIQNDNSIGFQFIDGFKFLQELILAIKLENEDISIDEARVIKMKLCRDKYYRYLQLRASGKIGKLEVQKPTKDQSDLFNYEWIDGVHESKIMLSVNCSHILQILKFAGKFASSTYFQSSQNKILLLLIDIEARKITLKLKADNSFVEANSIINSVEGDYDGDEKYLYEIRLDDSELVSTIIKKQSSFIIDGMGNLVSCFTDDVSNCQIELKKWIYRVDSSNGINALKYEP